MKISNPAQELLESLWIRSQEGDSSSLDDPLALQELVQLGLVESGQDSFALTADGLAQAALAIRRHRLAERLLADVLITEEAFIDERACGLEHALFDGVDESICTLLGHPGYCPHGKPIPPGECCKKALTTVSPVIAPLSNLKRGQQGRIAYLRMQQSDHLNKLLALGVLPGAEIRVKQTSPAYVFETGYSQYAVDREIAQDILVRLTPR